MTRRSRQTLGRRRSGLAGLRGLRWGGGLALILGAFLLSWLGRDGEPVPPTPPRAPESAPGEVAGELRGPVTHVRDGDTVEVDGVAVRIANLNCAERDTSEGQAASARMRELVAGEAVACALEGRRSWDREVGTCALARTGEDLGETLIAEGTCGRWR